MEETSTQARRYSRLKTRLTIVQLLLTAAFLVIMLFSGASIRLRDSAAAVSGNFYLQVAFYMTIFSGIYYLLFVGLDFYGDFLLEHKFLLSNQTVPGWLRKTIKKALLSLAMLLVAGEALYFFLRHFPERWWLLTTAAWLLFTIVLGRIAPVLIIPLFYKCVPLANMELRDRLLALGRNCGVRIGEVFEIQLSKETRKANAAVVGLGKNRRILLGDTLLKNYSDDEIEAIFAHELAHIRLLHVRKILGFGTGASAISFYLTALLFKEGTRLFAFADVYDIAAFPLLALILMAVWLLLMPIQLWYLRNLEQKADIFAVEHIENRGSFASAMTKLAKQNLADPSPTRLEELLLYDHPPVSKRLRYACSEKARRPEEAT
ncbi:MAG TPA: M48 family metallopeptidase [Sedimentisphaerales bacterium]|nr:M48 family metallopeptidase [Sedimentisphaerales bacterium]